MQHQESKYRNSRRRVGPDAVRQCVLLDRYDQGLEAAIKAGQIQGGNHFIVARIDRQENDYGVRLCDYA